MIQKRRQQQKTYRWSRAPSASDRVTSNWTVFPLELSDCYRKWTNRSLWHSVDVLFAGFPTARLILQGFQGWECYFIGLWNVGLSEKSQVDNNAGIGFKIYFAIWKWVTVDLNVPREIAMIRYHHLGLRIAERNWQWVVGVLIMVGFDPLFPILISSVPDRIDDLPLQNNLTKRQGLIWEVTAQRRRSNRAIPENLWCSNCSACNNVNLLAPWFVNQCQAS